MKFSEIPGQRETKGLLAEQVAQGNLAHALLFQGQPGSTALAMAVALAELLMCEDRRGQETCGACSSCQKMAKLAHPDVHFVVPVSTTDSVKKDAHTDLFMDQWRTAFGENPYLSIFEWLKRLGIEKKQGLIGVAESQGIMKKLALRSYEGRARIFIIWQAEKMNPQMANKLLKSLEEPPENTFFFLTTESADQLLPTILSRVQKFVLKAPHDQEVVDFLVGKYGVTAEKAAGIAFRTMGNISEAISEAREDEDRWLELFRTWMRACYKREIHKIHLWSEGMASAGREEQKQFLVKTLKALHRCYSMNFREENFQMEGEELQFYKNFAPFVNEVNIEAFMKELNKALFHIERNVNQKIVWFDLGIRAIQLLKAGRESVGQG